METANFVFAAIGVAVTLGGALLGVILAFRDMQNKVTTLDERVKQHETQLGDLRTAVTAIRVAVDRLGEDHKTHGDELKALNSTLSEMGRRVDALPNTIASLLQARR